MTPMGKDEFHAALAKLKFKQTGAAFGLSTFLGVNDVTVRRWASGETIPNSVAILLRLMVKLRMEPKSVTKMTRDVAPVKIKPPPPRDAP